MDSKKYSPQYGSVSSGEPADAFKGEVQPKRFRDVPFGLAFFAHLGVILYFLIAYGIKDNGQNDAESDYQGKFNLKGDTDGEPYDYKGVLFCVCICGAVALLLSSLALGFMIAFSTQLVKVSLIFSVLVSLAVGISCAIQGQIFMSVMAFLCFAFGCCYAYGVWGRIDFAASNLNTALSAVKANMGLALVAYFLLLVAFGWSILWSIAAGGAMHGLSVWIIFLFLVSYYWTHQVIMNTMHVTTAGVIGTWWFLPDEATSFCSSALKDSFVRATTYSFGSICFGSILVAIVKSLRSLNRMLKENDGLSFLVCIIECLLCCIQGVIEYLNTWAYVYVGLYGYSFIEGGKNVMTLFETRGWTTIITDDLVDNVLFMMNLCIGLVVGLVGLIIASIYDDIFAGIGCDDNELAVGFVIGFLVGYVLASILMSVVGSAVNTIIVCFAEAPAEFEANHPVLSGEMRASWKESWPMECGNL